MVGDGGRLFVVDPSGRPAGVYTVDVASGRRELWRDSCLSIGCVFPVALTPDATAYGYSYRQVRSDLYLLKGMR